MKVPVYDTQQVAERPLAPQRISNPGPTGLESIGQGLSNVGTILDRRATEIQEEDDAAQLTEVFAGASDQLRPVLHGDILERRGKDAFGAYEEADKTASDIAREARATLRTDQQRAAFDRMWASHRSGALTSVASHVARERQTYRQNMAEVGARAALEDAAAAWNNPEASQAAIKRGAAMIRANLHGQAPEVVTEKMQAYESQAHAAIIDRMAVAQPMAAKAYYQQHRDQIDGLTQGKVEKLLDSETLRAESQAAADRIVASGKGIDAQLEAARAISDPKLRDETVRRVKDRYNEDKAIRTQQKADLVDEAGRIILQGGTTDDLTPAHRDALGLQGFASAQKFVRDRLAGKSVPDYTPRYFELQEMATRDPEKFKDYQLVTDLGRVSPKQIGELYTLQRSIKKGDRKDLTFGRTWNQIAMDALPAGTKSTDDLARGFRRWVEEQLQVEGITKETPDWRNRVQEIVDRGLIQGEIKGGFFGDPDRRLFQVNEGEQFFLDSVDRVPDAEQAKIRAALERAGRPVTDEAILELYQRKNGIQ